MWPQRHWFKHTCMGKCSTGRQYLPGKQRPCCMYCTAHTGHARSSADVAVQLGLLVAKVIALEISSPSPFNAYTAHAVCSSATQVSQPQESQLSCRAGHGVSCHNRVGYSSGLKGPCQADYMSCTTDAQRVAALRSGGLVTEMCKCHNCQHDFSTSRVQAHPSLDRAAS